MGSVLTLDHVTKDFGGLRAVDDVSLEIESGQILGVIGPNGAGKSTVFNLICGVYHPTNGRIFFDGKSIERLTPDQVCKRGIGRTFQLSEMFKSFTTHECVTLAASLHLPMKEAKKRAEDLLERFGLSNKARWRCGSLTPVDMKLIELSKALATQPKVILLDEVMSGLTHVEAEPVLQQIKKLPEEGVTPVIVEHGMHIIKAACERVVVLNFGHLIADGGCDEVMRNKDVIDSYLGVEIASA